MPEMLQHVPNFYRHVLNQRLQRASLDPELRHAQLGWIVSPAHLFADMGRQPTEPLKPEPWNLSKSIRGQPTLHVAAANG